MSLALATNLACPASITDRQEAHSIPSGWKAQSSSGPRLLRNVDVYSGLPKRNFLLVGSDVPSNITVWTFSGQQDIWVECRYENSAIVLTRNMGKIKKCNLTPRKGGSLEGAKFSCSR
ncbi:STY0301 family protein [Arenimonas oryziterrae]|uniref:STY0301 family protein n=1 Tax=Arenimonas oryziterrae TaxID=498055 RepID=UPI003CCB95BC